MSHLSQEQRYTISVMLEKNYSQKEIAATICKHKSVVSRELKRNCDLRNGAYRSDLAQRKYEQRQESKPKHESYTAEVKVYVEGQLKEGFSPEQIVGRAKLLGLKMVSHECIYTDIWKDKKLGGNLHESLRHNGRKYRKRGALKDTRGIIKNRTDISQRPAIVDKKERFGDLEIDTVIGKNHQGALLTINDRVTGLVWIRILESKHEAPLTMATIKALNPFKEQIKTITADNGKEFAGHEKIAEELEIDMYFARPYHSWERGANENTNGLIRQYFPKGSSFENITQEQVDYVQNKLNNRPRKRLGFLSPNEFYQKNHSNQKVAFVT
jgi:IS30 family transposase